MSPPALSRVLPPRNAGVLSILIYKHLPSLYSLRKAYTLVNKKPDYSNMEKRETLARAQSVKVAEAVAVAVPFAYFD